MLLSEIIDETRDILDDSVPPYLWSDKFLAICANRAINDLCIKARVITDSTTTDICSISVVSGTKDYLYDSRIIEISRAKLSSQSYALRKRSVYYLDNHKRGWESDSDGIPTIYLTDKTTGYITLHPTPNTTDTLLLRVARLPLLTLSDEDMTVTPEIPAQYHEDIIDGILGYAYSKQDTETFDPIKAERYKGMWKQRLIEITNEILIESSVDTNIDPIPDYMDE